MKKRRIWLIIALSCMIFGFTLFVIGMSKVNWDFKKLDSRQFETNDYEIVDKFDNISIDADTANIDFRLSTDGKCKVVCYENKKEKHNTCVVNDVLTIKCINEKKWYEHLTFGFNNPQITVYLPNVEYKKLTIEVSTGDIKIESDFTFESISISGSTSDVNCYASTIKQTKIHLNTGDICIENTNAESYDLHVSTGEIKMNSVNCKNIVTTGSTGDIKLNNVLASEKISIKRSTGDVELYKCDANELVITTSTGDVEGSLLSDKEFIIKTSTGDIDVPSSLPGGKCQVTTFTGDVELKIVN